MRILKNVLKITGCIILVIVAVILIRTLTVESKQARTENTNLDIKLNMDKASKKVMGKQLYQEKNNKLRQLKKLWNSYIKPNH